MNIHETAQAAAAHWQGKVVGLISNRENAVFELMTPQGRAALRLHRQGYQQAGAIRSELWWCEALADAGVSVPRPLPARDGSLLVQSPDGRLSSCIKWMDGKPLGRSGVAFDAPMPVLLDRHVELGRLLAKLHAETDKLTLPGDFLRPRWDIDGFVGESPHWGRFWDHPVATKAEVFRLGQIRHWLQQQLHAHAVDGDFGLIHADVLRENVLVNDRSLSLIDFDDSGYGFRLCDLGTAMLHNIPEPAYDDLLDALLDGYGINQPKDRAAIEMFILARTCASVGWTATRRAPDDPVNKSHIARCLTFADRIIR